MLAGDLIKVGKISLDSSVKEVLEKTRLDLRDALAEKGNVGNASPRWIFRSWPIPAASFASAASATTSNLSPGSGCRSSAG